MSDDRIERSLTESPTTGNEIQVDCASCGKGTAHKVLASARSDISRYISISEDRAESIDNGNIYEIVQCMGCKEISFRHAHWFSEDTDYRGSPILHVDQWPNWRHELREEKRFENLPKNLTIIYAETITAFNYKCPLLVAGGLRAIIEGVCANQNVTDGPKDLSNQASKRGDNLYCKINGLCEKKILTQSHAEILHQHRILGNEALHELSIPEYKVLELALDIVEGLFHQVYEIPAQGNALRKAMTKPTSPAPQKPQTP